MRQVAKLFINGRSQAVRLPLAYRLSRKPNNWDNFFSLLKNSNVPEDFLNPTERNQPTQNRDPFEGWNE